MGGPDEGWGLQRGNITSMWYRKSILFSSAIGRLSCMTIITMPPVAIVHHPCCSCLGSAFDLAGSGLFQLFTERLTGIFRLQFIALN